MSLVLIASDCDIQPQMGWNLNYAGIARMWRGGCIIKSVFLGDITKAYEKNIKLESLLFDDFFNRGKIHA